MSGETRGCVAVVAIVVLLLAVGAWYCLSHGCCVSGWGFAPKPDSEARPSAAASPTSSQASTRRALKVAVLDEPSAPDYVDGPVGNSYERALEVVRSLGLDAEAITSDEIEAGMLDGYDLLIHPDNAPPTSGVCDGFGLVQVGEACSDGRRSRPP